MENQETYEVATRQGYGVINFEESAMSVESMVHQINLIQKVQRTVMRQGEHYGTIPGCGDKPTLLKPGAEKLGFVFRLAPEFEMTVIDWQGGHREYQIKCRLRHIPTGTIVGEGLGSCSTLEGKYRYRWDNTGKEVPKAYWTARDSDLIGGPFYAPRKIDKQWFIFQKVEHDNPADYFNTCEKMGKKRAHVDAILTATAASDIFTQDLEDMTEVIPGAKNKSESTPPKPPIQKPQQKKNQDAQIDDPEAPSTEAQLKAIRNMLNALHIDDDFERMAYISNLAGLEKVVESEKALTKSQASIIISAISAEIEKRKK